MCVDRSLAIATLCCALAFSGANAQGFGGSFDTPTPSGQQPAPGGGSFGDSSGQDTVQQQPPTAGNNGFGGSFDGDTLQQQPEQDVAAAPGGNNFSGGSFDDGGTITPGPEKPTPKVTDDKSQQPEPRPQNNLDPQILAFEMRDFGVPPTNRLRSGQMHGATPTSIPGAQVVGTEALLSALQSGQQVLLIDVLGGNYSLPGAFTAPPLAEHGNFGDRTQQRAAQWLQQITGGAAQTPIVIYCSDPQCWLSYNATLRVVAAGYTNVYWYRGGLQAWQMAGLQLAPTGF